MNHEDFKVMSDAEFRERFGMAPKAEPETPAPKPLKPAEIARQAATLAWRISNEEPDPAKWKARIEAAPEELRACLREYLAQKWRTLQRQAKGKRSEAGDATMAELGKRYG